MSVFIDTSGFRAVMNKDEERHTKAATTWLDILAAAEDLLTTNYVLMETCTLVQSRLGMKALRVFQEDIVPVLRIVWIDTAVHLAAMGIMLSAIREKLRLVACASFETTRLEGTTTAFTLDRYFKAQGFICLPE